MLKSNLTRASKELFRRTPDEVVGSLDELMRRCSLQRQRSVDRWQLPQTLRPIIQGSALGLEVGSDGAFALNDWSFGQMCRMAGVSRDTINRLSPATACQALQETLPAGKKPTQILTEGEVVRSVHGTQYTRLWHEELLAGVRNAAPGFEPPPKGFNGGTGLYLGEQDLFCFLVDPLGWAEIGGEAFAPGFFVWNSEVGCRSLGVQTFWWQAVCANHVVWDAVEVIDSSWKHTAKVHESLDEMMRLLESLVHKRDARRDGFVRVLSKAMTVALGKDAEESVKALAKNGIPLGLAKQACELVAERGKRFTIFALVDALTRLNQKVVYAGDRADLDAKVGTLLALAV